MRRELAIEFSRVTKPAAPVGYKRLGRGDKNIANGAAVNAMRIILSQVNIDGTIIISEGEIDEVPMLYIGEKVGTGCGDTVNIAIDPIGGTCTTAMGQTDALAALVIDGKGCFLNAPDVYMERSAVGLGTEGIIDLNLSLANNLCNAVAALDKPLNGLTVTVLAKPRHDAVTAKMQQLGVRVSTILNGDVAASTLTRIPDSEVDVLYGISGAPEGVVSATVIRTSDGDTNGRLLACRDVKDGSKENCHISEQELARCKAMGTEAGKVLRLDDIACSDSVIFSATGITKDGLLEGTSRKGNTATTEALLIRGKSRTIRRIQSIYYLDRKDPEMQVHTLWLIRSIEPSSPSGLEFSCSENEDKANQSRRKKGTVDWVTGKVAKVQSWTDALLNLTVHAPVLPFTAGQFIKPGFGIRGERIQRTYSYINSPDNPNPELYLVTVPDGKLSPRLAVLEPGGGVQVISKAADFFALGEVSDCETLWMLAADTAIGLYLSILQLGRDLERFKNMVLVRATRYATDLGYPPLMQELEKRYGGKLRTQMVASQGTAAGSLTGRLPALVESGEPESAIGLPIDKETNHVMLCSSPQMVRDTQQLLKETQQMTRHLRHRPGHMIAEHY